MNKKLQDNLKRVQDRIASACARCGRSPDRITLVIVTKYVSLDVIRQWVELGQIDLGENRPQELVRRAAATQEWLTRRARDPNVPHSPLPRWHMIGHVQRNKVKKLLPWVSLIHSVDTLRLAEEIDEQSARLGTVTPVLLEVNATGEPAKHGVAFPAFVHLAEVLTTLKHIRLCGMMAMGPLTSDERETRTAFERVRELFDETRSRRIGGSDFAVLSLGMSADFEYAIEVGATHLRLGSVLYEGLETVAIGHAETKAEP